ncbi:MAG: aromatic ring-hydroxylating oxygenase subunit alpha [Gammaproteobacteria bacterium]
MNRSSIINPDIARLVDDRPADGIFRVQPDAFTDRDIFERELAQVFEGTWVFLGLEAEVAEPHAYITRRIGRRGVILTRNGDGELRCFLNSCRHRGTQLCPLAAGNRKIHVCRYHGWSYDSNGRNIGVTLRDDGQYPPAFATADRDLVPLARLASYRGFVFASLSDDVPSLAEHLGDARILLDLVADQAPDGLEFIPGSASYTFDGNWKLQFENGLDAYHFPSTHAAFVNILKRRPAPPVPPDLDVVTDAARTPASGTISLPRGHAMSWSIGAPGQSAEQRPLTRDRALFARVRQQVGEERLDWMLRQRNLTIFPNVQVIDIQSLQLRTWEPLAVDKTRMTSYCLAPRGEDPEARRFRIRQYEEFFNAGGLATSDDNVMYEFSQAGYRTARDGSDGAYARGLGATETAGDPFAALGLERATCTYSNTGLGFGDETGIHAGYREWLRLLLGTGSSA